MSEIFDFVVIGGGSAGYNAAAQAVVLGLKTAVIEGGDEVGGLCILRGCMPSKTLIESANRNLTIRRAAEFGLRAEKTAVLGDEIIARKKRLISEFADYRREQLESGKFTFLRGHAEFRDANSLTVIAANGERTEVRGKTFLLATGSTLNWVEIPGLKETGFLDSDAVLDNAHIPKSVIVLGGGATALEFAHYYSGLGAEVTIIQRGGQLLKETDSDVAEALTEAFRKRGVNVHLKTKLLRVEKCDGKKCVYFEQNRSEQMTEAEEIIYALGRTPQLAQLALERAGIKVEKGKISVSETQQTDAPHIFAAGDVAGPYEIVHIAVQQGELAARNAAKLVFANSEALANGEAGATAAPLEKMDYRLKLFITFTEPQVAIAGACENELAEQKKTSQQDYRVASYPFDDHGKSLVIGETDGFVKLIATADSGEILGGAVIGPHAADLIHEIVVAMAFHATVSQLAKIPHYHPTLSEIWTYPAEELAEETDRE